jgi:hypothetical protein
LVRDMFVVNRGLQNHRRIWIWYHCSLRSRADKIQGWRSVIFSESINHRLRDGRNLMPRWFKKNSLSHFSSWNKQQFIVPNMDPAVVSW